MRKINKNINLVTLFGVLAFCVGCSETTSEENKTEETTISAVEDIEEDIAEENTDEIIEEEQESEKEEENDVKVSNNEIINNSFEEIKKICKKYNLKYNDNVEDEEEELAKLMDLLEIKDIKALEVTKGNNNVNIESLFFYSATIIETDSPYSQFVVEMAINENEILSNTFNLENSIIPELDYALTGEELNFKGMSDILIGSYNAEHKMAMTSKDKNDISRTALIYDGKLTYAVYCAPGQFLKDIQNKIINSEYFNTSN
jgi:hypothetical protein